jgi:hypothetical protein
MFIFPFLEAKFIFVKESFTHSATTGFSTNVSVEITNIFFVRSSKGIVSTARHTSSTNWCLRVMRAVGITSHMCTSPR